MANISSTLFNQEDSEHTIEGLEFFNLTEEQKSYARINNIVYYSFLLPVGILGNVFTLSAVFMVLRIKKSIPNILIGSLAFADITSIFTCHIIAIISMSHQQSIGGDILCRFQSVMGFTYFKLGFFSKTCISIDRFIALKYPLKYRSIVTRKRVIWIIVLFTLFSISSSCLTWILDPKYIMELETWYMCTNDFSQYTHYKLAVVITEGTIFLCGVAIFFIGNITVVKVMLDLGSKIKKIEESDNTLSKLKLMPLSIVTRASVGFTDMATIAEKEESDDSNNNEKSEHTSEDVEEINTPLSKRAKEKLNNVAKSSVKDGQTTSNGQLKHSTRQTNDPTRRLSVPQTSSHRFTTFSNGKQLHSNSPPQFSKDYNSRNSMQRLSVPNSPATNGIAGKGRRKSIFKRVVELSSKAVAKKKENRQKKELQFAKLVMVIVTVFVILWIPFMFTIYYEHSNRKRIHPLMLDISLKLVFANACINPILYGLFNANFRKAYVYYIKMLAFYLTCKKSERPDGKNMPWSVVMPVYPPVTHSTPTATTPVKTAKECINTSSKIT